MAGQGDINPTIDIEPFRMVINDVGIDSNTAHETECAHEVAKTIRLCNRVRVFLQRPALQISYGIITFDAGQFAAHTLLLVILPPRCGDCRAP